MHAKKHNGSASELDVDHELPSAENEDEPAQAIAGEVARPDATDLQSELERVRNERAAYLDRAARLQAEFENYRKRAAKEQQDFRDYALAEALKSLLPVLDSLDGALKTNAASLDDLRAGVELIDKQFHDALAKLGVQPVPAEGEPFDPNVHQAIQMVDTDEAADNQVLDELQRGYKLKERLLRPAMVRVARNPKP